MAIVQYGVVCSDLVLAVVVEFDRVMMFDLTLTTPFLDSEVKSPFSKRVCPKFPYPSLACILPLKCSQVNLQYFVERHRSVIHHTLHRTTV